MAFTSGGGRVGGEVGCGHSGRDGFGCRFGHGFGGEHHFQVVARSGIKHLHNAAVGHRLVGIEGNEAGGILLLCQFEERHEGISLQRLGLFFAGGCEKILFGVDIRVWWASRRSVRCSEAATPQVRWGTRRWR